MVNATEIMAALAGTYSLLNTSSTLNGVEVPDRSYGEAAVGIITYSKSGYMSATITATEAELRPLGLTFPFLDNQTDADWALVGKHSIGYAGPYTINPNFPATTTEGGVFHGPLTVANVPSMVGARHQRNYTIVQEDDRTLLHIHSRRDGGAEGDLWWVRLD
ncbi:Lipocalin-like domain-containing protein [Plectosphaerella plurivora]|uniref:Lipocalin-like domain-containing protein n=1 Tax=Plectosphaerella plurivora TaxID=936078 RepID=A0A9P8VNC9_9PEZI|nr:Lipocalin-like domain-containing protein [Plectosphaerella plurivora]